MVQQTENKTSDTVKEKHCHETRLEMVEDFRNAFEDAKATAENEPAETMPVKAKPVKAKRK